jgi:hypothetical protein
MIKRIFMTVVLLGGMFAVRAYADTFIAGVENDPNISDTEEGIGDFNDMMLQLGAAGLTVNYTSGQWNPFSAGVVNETGPSTTNAFWDNKSLDDPEAPVGPKNIGFCLTTTNCDTTSDGVPYTGGAAAVTEFLTASGNEGAPIDFYFTFSGSSLNVSFLGAITPQYATEWIGIYNTANAGQIQWIVENGVNVVGSSFAPDYTSFGLVFENLGSNGDVFYSQNSLGAYVDYAGTTIPDNRFALFDLPSSVPEPGTMVLFGIGALTLGIVPRLRKRR